MSLRNIFSAKNFQDITDALFGSQTSHRCAVIDEEFADETVFIKAGTKVHYFFKSEKIDDNSYRVKLLTSGRGLTSILPAPWMAVRYHQVTDYGLFNKEACEDLFNSFEKDIPLAACIKADTPFLKELVGADASRSDRLPLKSISKNFDHYPN